MKKRKVLYVSSTDLRNPLRGTPIRIHHLLEELAKHHSVTVCTKGTDVKEVEFVPYPECSPFKKLLWLAKFVRRNNIEVILTSTETNIKLPVLLKFLTGAPIGIDVHGLLHEEWRFKGTIGGWRSWQMKMQTAFWLFWYDRWFPVSKILGSYYAWANSKYEPVYGGVTLGDFPQHQEVDINTNIEPLVIGYMGNLRGYQGTEELIEALANIKKKDLFPFKLLFVVSGDVSELRAVIQKKGLDTLIELHQNIPHSEVGNLISKADVLSIPRPSHPMTEYAFPSKLPEYLALGVPVIVTNVGPVTELSELTSEIPYIIIPPHDIARELEEALMQSYIMGRSGRSEQGRRARKFVADYLSWEKIGTTLASSISSI